jgi:hypothetical protein
LSAKVGGLELLEQRHGRLVEAVKTETAALSARVGGLESLERKHGGLIEAVKTETAALSARVGGLELLEQRQVRLVEAVKRETAALSARLGGLESLEQKHGGLMEAVKTESVGLLKRICGLESLERKHGGLREAVKTENAVLRARVEDLESRKKIPLPPLGQGILRYLKQRNCIVEITVSSHVDGSTDNLLTEDDSYWASQNLPDSWIQWTITGGLKAIISSVKIRGDMRVPPSGVKDFIIEGSNDGGVWMTIIDSKISPMTFENCVTQAEALPQPQRSFTIIRLTQTGLRYCPDYPNRHYLNVSYVDFGGKVIFPETAK